MYIDTKKRYVIDYKTFLIVSIAAVFIGGIIGTNLGNHYRSIDSSPSYNGIIGIVSGGQ